MTDDLVESIRQLVKLAVAIPIVLIAWGIAKAMAEEFLDRK